MFSIRRARLLLLAGGVALVAEPTAPARPDPGGVAQALARTTFGRLGTRFERNVGQHGAGVRFVARGHAATVGLTDDAAVLRLRGSDTPVTLRVVGGRKATPRAEARLVTTSNYLIGDDPAQWRTNVPNFGRVTYPDVLPGVDLVYHGEEGQLEYDFVVASGADSAAIVVEVEGASGLTVSPTGDLVMRVGAGVLVQPRPRVFQRDSSGIERAVAAEYRLVSERAVAFAIADYDHARELVIDPVLSYGTYLGGSGSDVPWAVAVDAAGSVYVAGQTASADFPTLGAVQASGGGGDVFVSKLNPAGTALVYSTYIGGASAETGTSLALDAAGNAYIAGNTTSTNFPLVGQFQGTNRGSGDAFVAKLNPAGDALVYSTYLGGTSADNAYAIAVDTAGSAYVTGFTESINFPLQGAFQGARGSIPDAFVTKLSPAGSTLAYSTYLGGSSYDYAYGIAVDAAGCAYVGGTTASTNFPVANALQSTLMPYPGGTGLPYDGFVTKLTAAGDSLVYSTYFGGARADYLNGLAIDAATNVYIMGRTNSADFPTKNPIQAAISTTDDLFVAKLNAGGASLGYSTYLGGVTSTRYGAIAVDGDGSAVVTGSTHRATFPLKNPIQAALGGGADAYVAKLNPAGSALVYSTFYGGAEADVGFAVAVDSANSVYVAGFSPGTDLLTMTPYQAANRGATDAFLLKLTTPPLALAPVTVTLPPGGAQTFVAAGGSGAGYVYALRTNASGGTIDAATGAYTAGLAAPTTDVVEVSDSDGLTTTSTVSVTSPADAGAGDGGRADAATPLPDAGTPSDAATPTVDAAVSGADAAVPEGGAGEPVSCSCDVAGRASRGGGAGWLALGLAALGLRRRRPNGPR